MLTTTSAEKNEEIKKEKKRRWFQYPATSQKGKSM